MNFSKRLWHVLIKFTDLKSLFKQLTPVLAQTIGQILKKN